MDPITLQPDPKYQQKMFLVALFVGVLGLLFTLAMAIPIGLSEGGNALLIAVLIGIGANALYLIPWFLLIPPYYRSLTYEIQDDEVIVRVGIITKSVKHVPYRTVTNLEVKRDPFDRLLGLGTLKIQTAGMSGQTGAEESLVGLVNYQEIYETVAVALRRFRSAMAPTAAGEDLPAAAAGLDPSMNADTLASLLAEVQAIRELLSEDQER